MSTKQIQPFADSHICGKCGRQYSIPRIRFCPHPKPNREFGAHICYYYCQRCAFSSNIPLCGALNCDVFKMGHCMQGVFWVIDEKLICVKSREVVPVKRHKKEWEYLSTEITQGKPYNHYPMGRVDLRYNRPVIYLQPVIHTAFIVKMVVKEFHLENVIYQVSGTEAVLY